MKLKLQNYNKMNDQIKELSTFIRCWVNDLECSYYIKYTINKMYTFALRSREKASREFDLRKIMFNNEYNEYY